MKKKSRAKTSLGDILFIGIFVAVIFAAFRYDIRYVETGSMEPGIHVGALCFIDPHAYDDAPPEVGDIAMYETSTRAVIHRIIQVDDGGCIFKGDNNRSADYSIVPLSQIRGKVVHTLNFVSPLICAFRHLL